MRHVERQLSDYLDGGLAPARRERVEQHLAGCARCAAELGALRRTVAGLRALPEPEAPPGLADAVMRRVRSEESPRGFGARLRERLAAFARNGLTPPLAAAATAALAIVVVQGVDIEIGLPSGEGPVANTQAPAIDAREGVEARQDAPQRARTQPSPSTLASSEPTAPAQNLAGRSAQADLWTPPLAIPQPGLQAEGRCADPESRDPICVRLQELRAFAGRADAFELTPPPFPFPQPSFAPQPGRGLPAGFERAAAPTR